MSYLPFGQSYFGNTYLHYLNASYLKKRILELKKTLFLYFEKSYFNISTPKYVQKNVFSCMNLHTYAAVLIYTIKYACIHSGNQSCPIGTECLMVSGFFRLAFWPPFEYQTIWQPDKNLPFKHQTSLVFRWLLDMGSKFVTDCLNSLTQFTGGSVFLLDEIYYLPTCFALRRIKIFF